MKPCVICGRDVGYEKRKACPEHKTEYYKAYRKARADLDREYQRQWRAANPDYHRDWGRDKRRERKEDKSKADAAR